MKIKDFEAIERLEIETAVADSYTAVNGDVLPHREAAERFDQFLADAIQAHRPWAGRLLDAFRRDGAAAFAKDTWKHSEFFQFRHNDKARTRTVKRGRQRADDDAGTRVWVQEELFGWDVQALKDAIADAVRQMDEHRANIAMYRHLLDLMERTDQSTVRDALASVGMSLEEYLEQEEAA